MSSFSFGPLFWLESLVFKSCLFDTELQINFSQRCVKKSTDANLLWLNFASKRVFEIFVRFFEFSSQQKHLKQRTYIFGGYFPFHDKSSPSNSVNPFRCLLLILQGIPPIIPSIIWPHLIWRLWRSSNICNPTHRGVCLLLQGCQSQRNRYPHVSSISKFEIVDLLVRAFQAPQLTQPIPSDSESNANCTLGTCQTILSLTSPGELDSARIWRYCALISWLSFKPQSF